MTLDTRYTPPRLLICDRNREPRGRLVHYDLDGHFLAEVLTGLGLPCSTIDPGGLRRRARPPGAGGRSWTRATSSSPSSATTPTPPSEGNFNVPQDRWVEGIFNAVHGSCWDKDGNLYIQDWNVAGRDHEAGPRQVIDSSPPPVSPRPPPGIMGRAHPISARPEESSTMTRLTRCLSLALAIVAIPCPAPPAAAHDGFGTHRHEAPDRQGRPARWPGRPRTSGSRSPPSRRPRSASTSPTRSATTGTSSPGPARGSPSRRCRATRRPWPTRCWPAA